VRMSSAVVAASGGGTIDPWLVCVWHRRLVLVAVWLVGLLGAMGWPGLNLIAPFPMAQSSVEGYLRKGPF
jgi:hypothetical protein